MNTILNFLYSLLELQNFLMFLISVLVFFTVVTLVMPLLASQDLKKKARQVTVEREQLRARQRAELMQRNKGRLREKPKGLAAQIVEKLNLREIFQAETARKNLRTAGYRSEKHLVTFLTIRLVAPFVFAAAAFIISGTSFDASFNMRLVALAAGAAAGYYAPNIYLNNQAQRRQESIRLAWSDALDLMLICVESGMSIEQAIAKVGIEIATTSVPLSEEMQLTSAELSYLSERTQAFENLAKRTGLPNVKSVVTALIQSERYGTPLGQALRVLAQENRDDRMAEAEKKAAALPPKLTVPMIGFFLPVIFVVLLGPALILVFKAKGG